MRHLRIVYLGLIVGFILFVSRPSNTVAQTTETPSTCNQLLTMVQKNLSADCGALDRDQVCYGNTAIKSEYADTANAPAFAKAGDIVPVSALKSISTSPLNLERSEWGIAVLKAQAGNLANTTAGQAVTFVLYGDTNVTDLSGSSNGSTASAAPVTCNATVTRQTRLRAAPNTNGQVVGQLESGATLKVSERSPDSAWVYGEVDGKTGWLFGGNLQLDCPVQKLSANDPNAPLKLPAVNAFYFSTGISAQSACTDIPPSGLLIQSPTGHKVAFKANGVDFTVGSSVVLSAQPKGQMKVSVLEGQVTVKSNGVQRTIKSSHELTIPLGGPNGLSAVGAPNLPQTIPDAKELNKLYLPSLCLISQSAGLTIPCEIVAPTATPTREITFGGGAPLAPDTSTPTSTNPPPPPPPGGGGGGSKPTSTLSVTPPTLTPTFTPTIAPPTLTSTPGSIFLNVTVNGPFYDVIASATPISFTATVSPVAPNIPVTFTASGGGTFVGGVTSVTTLTNTSGSATSPNFTRNTTAGPFTINFTAPAFTNTASITLSNFSAMPTAIVVANTSDTQTTLNGTTFVKPLAAQVQAYPSIPVEGVPVLFSTASGPAGAPGGVFGPNASGLSTFGGFTDATGTLSTPFTTFAGLPGLIMPGPIAIINYGTNLSVSFSALVVN